VSNSNAGTKIMGVVLLALLGMGWGNITALVYGEEGRGLFVEVADPTIAKDSVAAFNPTIIRSRIVKIDWDILAVAEDSSRRKISAGNVLLLNLFDDTSLTARLYHGQARSEEHFIWTGHVEGDRGSQVTMVVQDGVMVGNIRVSGEFYQVRYLGGGVHVIYEIDETKFPPAGEPIPVRNPPSLVEDKIGAAVDDGSTLDVMVVYTPAARAAAGSTTAMNALINLAITETNTAYSNSGVNPRVRLVHTEEVSYMESDDFTADLNCLTNATDGCIDNVHTLRDTHGADLVSLFIEGGFNCGLAWVMTDLSNNFESFAFSIVRRTCATGNFSFGHEIGHNMGLQHARANQPPDGVFPYSHGYVDPANKFRTIMGTGATFRIQHFSNPAVSFGGYPTGVDFQDPDSADSARSLNNTAITVANWRDSVSQVLPPDPRLSNISTRGVVGTGDNVMIGGLIIGGSGSKTVLIRARGPALGDFGIAGVLANPFLRLFDVNGTVIADNDDWETTTPVCQDNGLSCGGGVEIIATQLDPCRPIPLPGQPPTPTGCDLESAILVTLPPGNYTAIVSGVGGGIGVGLVEVFEAD